MLLSFLEKYREGALLFMRISLGILFVLHGLPMLVHTGEWHKTGMAMAAVGITSYPAFWGLMAALAEVVGGFLVVIGVFFRPACLFIAITMTVATIHHYKHHDDFNTKLSHAAEMAVVFYGLTVIGPGKYSVDKG